MTKVQYKFKNKLLEIFVRGEADISVASEIFKHREYRRSEEAITKAVFPIVDVGAHIGLFTIYCRALNPKVKIFLLEPDMENLSVLKDNLRVNHIGGTHVVSAALGGQTAQRRLVVSDDHLNNCLADYGSKEKNLPVVKTFSFKDFCSDNKLTKISFLKMDIEGGEDEVIDSLSADEFSSIGSIMMEYHNLKIKGHKFLESVLRQNGFGVEIFPSKFDKSMGFIFAHNKRFKF